jgi:hypothetical protein
MLVGIDFQNSDKTENIPIGVFFLGQKIEEFHYEDPSGNNIELR